MNRGWSACVRRDGAAKVCYSDRATARRAARLVQQHIGRVEAYRCETCRKYHLGHYYAGGKP